MPESQPKIGLVIDQLGGSGGLDHSAARHASVLAGHAQVVPVALMRSERESDWSGRIERVDQNGTTAYQVWSADFRLDVVLSQYGAGNLDVSQRSMLDCLVRVAKSERFDAI